MYKLIKMINLMNFPFCLEWMNENHNNNKFINILLIINVNDNFGSPKI